MRVVALKPLQGLCNTETEVWIKGMNFGNKGKDFKQFHSNRIYPYLPCVIATRTAKLLIQKYVFLAISLDTDTNTEYQ